MRSSWSCTEDGAKTPHPQDAWATVISTSKTVVDQANTNDCHGSDQHRRHEKRRTRVRKRDDDRIVAGTPSSSVRKTACSAGRSRAEKLTKKIRFRYSVQTRARPKNDDFIERFTLLRGTRIA